MKRKMARLLAASVLCAQCSFGAAYGYAANAEAAGADAPIGGDLFVNRISAEDRQIIEAVTDNFMLLTKVPRPSGYMEKISPFLLNWAREQGFDPVQDEALNIIFDVPATEGMESLPLCVLQGHMDMVCVGVDGKQYDPQNDPITVIRDDVAGTLTADGTSLGADDGAGVAIIMAVAQGRMAHGPIRVIITVTEETTMYGVQHLDKKYVQDAAYLINIDSEESDIVTVSSAAGANVIVTSDVKSHAPEGDAAAVITLSGLTGGHSGMDIGKGRLNAIRELGDALTTAGVSYEVASISGGSANNAIPTKADITVAFAKKDREKFRAYVSAMNASLHKQYAGVENGLTLSMADCALPKAVVAKEDVRRARKFAEEIINGVYTMSKDYEGLVESSSNLGVFSLSPEKGLYAATYVRSSRGELLETIKKQQIGVAESCGFAWKEVRISDPWPFNPDSKLLALTKQVYRELNGKDIKVEAVHAGLECGEFSMMNPRLDIVSIGPDVVNVHSPGETLYLASIPKTWRLLEGLLHGISQEQE
jgi:dipeptidase D